MQSADTHLTPADYLQHARQLASQGPEWPACATLPNDQVLAVIGAGTMGRGIAQAGLVAGLHVVVHDLTESALTRCVTEIENSLSRNAARQALPPGTVSSQLQRLQTTTDLTQLASADILIEAVYENLALKQQVLEALAAICPPHTLRISNTSTLDIDALAAASGHPRQTLGMHFLTPAHITPLVEVVQGRATGPEALARAKRLAERLGKLPVLCHNAWGFIGNRMYEGFLAEVDALQLAGVPAHVLDTALEDFGFALGPCRTLDRSGTDLVSQVIAERGKRVPQAPAYRRVTQLLAEHQRYGVKSGLGHYRYEGRQTRIDPELTQLVRQEAERLGLPQQPIPSPATLVQRCLAPLITEGQRLLQEGIACRESDIDLVWVLGYGFPASTGGPMYLSRRQGLDHPGPAGN